MLYLSSRNDAKAFFLAWIDFLEMKKMKHLTYIKSPKSEVMEMGFKLIQSLSGLNMFYQLLTLAFGTLNTPLLKMKDEST